MRPFGALCVLGLVVGFSAGTASAAPGQPSCRPTLSDSSGPNRGTPPLRAKIGRGHVLTGVVLGPTCMPVPGARVSFWQSNRKGVYTLSGRGAVMTDRSGSFRFEGPMPTSYGGGSAHIHIKVDSTDFEPLYTTYFPRGSRRGSVRLVLEPSQL
jgi:protocatechuate 3,4-dioxygenase beta subunit